MKRSRFIIVTVVAVAMWPLAAIAQNQNFTIGPPANPAAKLRAQEKAAADRRAKIMEKKEECKKRTVAEKIPVRERKAFMASCEKSPQTPKSPQGQKK